MAAIGGARELVSRFDADDTDFYRCFRPGGGLAFTRGPDHQLVAPSDSATCTGEVAVAPDGRSFLSP